MNIQGVQKLTLLDYPEKVACTMFTAGCNFRCPFCHNASLVSHIDMEKNIPVEKILTFLKKRSGVLDGICISGGEPLLQPDLEDFIFRVKEMGYFVKLDTNGSNSYLLRHLAEKKLLDYVAMDIKNAPAKYGITIGIAEYNLEEVFRSVDFLLSGVIPYEFRTTVVREFHKREDFSAIGRWIKGAGRYYLQNFQDSGDLIRPGVRAYTRDILVQALEVVQRYVPNAELRGME